MDAKAVLQAAPDNVKAHFRAGQAYIAVKVSFVAQLAHASAHERKLILLAPSVARCTDQALPILLVLGQELGSAGWKFPACQITQQALHLVPPTSVKPCQPAHTTVLQEWSEACQHLNKAVALDDKDAGIRSALAQARKGKDAAKQKERAAYAKMFG